MKTRTRRPSRRDFLKTTAWAAPLALSGVAFPVSKVSAATASDVLELGARAAVDRIRKGEMKCEDYMGRLFAHYEANKNLNPWVSFNPSRALSAARAVDQARAKGDKLGMLAGLPIAVKDNLDVAGFPTAIGNRALLGNIAKQSATVIATVEKHGAIVIAKANMSQFGGLSPSGATSNNRHFGQPRNPYNPAHISGGSSGGPGTAVSARFVPAAFGEDSGGSVRFPASASGVVGMRPSTGGKAKRYSDAGFMPPPTPDTKTVGPLARTMADLAFLDTAVTGDAVRPVKLAEVRIGIPDASYWDTKI
jgi:Asp-tRNA(Asn)/Glu-tRNA(Gln) amidotransferase A subunit family amidase